MAVNDMIVLAAMNFEQLYQACTLVSRGNVRDQGQGDVSRPSHPGLWTSLTYFTAERLRIWVLNKY